MNAADLLPSNHNYYTFDGSLTTPPCTEGVSWYVLETPVSFSKAQIEKFASIYPGNARPIQPLNNRVVQKSK
jgi:carbonic anhydrase